MKALIIEEEKLSAEHLENLLQRIDKNITVVANYDSVKRTVEELRRGLSVDLMFVDIHLADGLSFDIFSKISVDTPVIFTTAYNEYAIRAFKVNAVDYLLKPIGIEELRIAIDKFRKQKGRDPALILENLSNAYNSINKQHKTRFMVKTGDSISSVKCEDIKHFVSEDGAVILVTGDRRFVIDYTLDNLEEMVSPGLFFRINRKVMVNISAINKVATYFNSRLKIISDNLSEEECIVSRERVVDFKKWLDR
jgi:DNA-binding LytR/AlgR family response regulator